ncbi:uncharacterized protein LOC109609658 isoform X2 [Aethina tumida]|uniref:uncharacterized protein LOC109609658 isoform X2 n=1 Tax=Aethina tumida TaxID=116153 RepID=UPI0021478E2B|nr:uncharacterized protein LOC109609658 isoform X2 [Aethina tumida]
MSKRFWRNYDDKYTGFNQPLRRGVGTNDDAARADGRRFHSKWRRHQDVPKLMYCLYLTSLVDQSALNLQKLRQQVKGTIQGKHEFTKSSCGIIANFKLESDFDNFQKIDFHKLFGVPVLMERLDLYEKNYRFYVSFINIPTCISTLELSLALKRQGIQFGNVVRLKSRVEVEVFTACNMKRLLVEGLNFYDTISFASSDCWWQECGREQIIYKN